MSGFKAFLLRGNVVDLAIAIVIGIAFGVVISALIKDLITPLLAAIGGQPNFSALHFTLNHSTFLYGDFINAVIAFILLAAVIYFFVIVPYNRMMMRYKPMVAEVPTRDCPSCLSSIPAPASRCPFCTSNVEPVSVAPAVPAD